MNQLCKVCGEPAAGFHFGAFTCEGCKSFFGRTYNNLSQVHECKNGGQCVINKQNRTSCKACRLRKCLMVGMSKSGSRYGRRSNWFKIHCLLQEQATQLGKGMEGGGMGGGGGLPLHGMLPSSFSLSPASMPALSPAKSEDEGKVDSPLLSSPESCPSEGSVDMERRPHSPGGGDGGRGAAGLALYLHPGLSLLHASHLYSRLYPPVLYPGLTLPPTRPPPPPSPKRERSPISPSPLEYLPPPPPFALPLGLPLHRKRMADSPLGEVPHVLPSRVWEAARAPEQDAPMDLSIKRQRLLPPQPVPAPPVSPPDSPLSFSIISTPTPPTSTPVNLTTNA